MNKTMCAARVSGFLAMLFCFMFIFLSLILFKYLPALEGSKLGIIYFTNQAGMALGAFLFPRCLPLPRLRGRPRPLQ